MHPATDQAPHQDFGFPLTPFGAAAFVGVNGVRLFITSLVFSVICTSVVVWGVQKIYIPVIKQCFKNSSESSYLAGGSYYSGFEADSTKLGSNSFLEVWAAKSVRVQTPHTSHFRALLTQDRIRIKSEFGYYLDVQYPQSWYILSGRSSLLSFWNASKSVFPVVFGVILWIGILIIWSVFSIFYSVFILIFGNLIKREINGASAYKVAMCGCYFGGITFSIAVILYVLGYIPLEIVSAFVPGQLVASLCFLMLAVVCLPRREFSIQAGLPGSNPFNPEPKRNHDFSSVSQSEKSENPFE